jgi:hypothetical protein
MKDRWIGQNVDLDLLSQGVKRFLEEKGFVVRFDKRKNESRVYGWPRNRDVGEPVLVKIHGHPEDFTVEFVPGESFPGLKILGPLYSLFGGGFLWLRELKSREFLEKLENQFWVFVDKTIANLKRTSSNG